MRTVSIFKNGQNQAIRLPKDLESEGVNELIIEKHGNSLILRPKRASWLSLLESPKADDDFLTEREDIFEDGRVQL